MFCHCDTATSWLPPLWQGALCHRADRYVYKKTDKRERLSVCGNEAYQYLHYINSRGCAKEQKSEKLSWKKKTLHTNSRFAYLYPRITSLHFRPSRLIHTNLLYKFLDWSLSWMLYLLLVSQALCTMLSYDHKKKYPKQVWLDLNLQFAPAWLHYQDSRDRYCTLNHLT